MILRVHPLARRESRYAASFYGQQRPGLGTEFLNELQNAYHSIAGSPRQFPSTEEQISNVEIRHFLMQRFPFRIIYSIDNNEVSVIAVAHGNRRPDYWFRRIR